jgi:hypothetical protein
VIVGAAVHSDGASVVGRDHGITTSTRARGSEQESGLDACGGQTGSASVVAAKDHFTTRLEVEGEFGQTLSVLRLVVVHDHGVHSREVINPVTVGVLAEFLKELHINLVGLVEAAGLDQGEAFVVVTQEDRAVLTGWDLGVLHEETGVRHGHFGVGDHTVFPARVTQKAELTVGVSDLEVGLRQALDDGVKSPGSRVGRVMKPSAPRTGKYRQGVLVLTARTMVSFDRWNERPMAKLLVAMGQGMEGLRTGPIMRPVRLSNVASVRSW